MCEEKKYRAHACSVIAWLSCIKIATLIKWFGNPLSLGPFVSELLNLGRRFCSAMSSLQSEKPRGSSVGHESYRPQHLTANRVKIIETIDLKELPGLPYALENCRELNKMLWLDVDNSVQVSLECSTILGELEDRIRYSPDGYQNVFLVEKAIKLVKQVKASADIAENDWILFFETEIWSVFELKSSFHFS